MRKGNFRFFLNEQLTAYHATNMLKKIIISLMLLTCTIQFTAQQVTADETSEVAKKSKKKKTAKEKREEAKAKREAAKAKKKAEKEAKKAEKEAAKAKKEAEAAAKEAQQAFADAEATTPVGQALKKMQFVGKARPNVAAEYYFVVRSSSTCPHCVKLLPDVIAAYKEMRATGKVELLYESFDNSAAAAAEHLSKHAATFPAAMRAEMTALPGAAPLLIPPPAAYVVDAQGKRIASGPLAPVLADWRKLTVDKAQ